VAARGSWQARSKKRASAGGGTSARLETTDCLRDFQPNQIRTKQDGGFRKITGIFGFLAKQVNWSC
jgi:hypothetical protein